MARPFRDPRRLIESLTVSTALQLVTSAADVVLLVDARGVIRDMAVGESGLPQATVEAWLGQPWVQTVTVESRPKVEALLAHDADADTPSWRQINHPQAGQADLPMLYAATPLDSRGRTLVVGRELRTVSELQRRLVEAQQSLENDFRRIRQAETRYRLLFDQSEEAIVVLPETGGQIAEANPAAIRLLDLPARKVAGAPFPNGFDSRGTRAVRALAERVRRTGLADQATVGLADGGRATVVMSMFRQDDGPRLLARIRPQGGGAAAPAGSASSLMASVVDHAPDGVVVTDRQGTILLANPAFVDLVQMPGVEQVRGESLDRWLGRPGTDLNVLVATLNQVGSLKRFATTLRGEHAAPIDVEIAGTAVPDNDPPCLGFTVRHVDRRLEREGGPAAAGPRSIEQLTQLVGRMPLKDLVRESTDLIEQLCIEAALRMTQDNRASAASLLGLSRQSLYVKLRRYGLGDLDGASGED